MTTLVARFDIWLDPAFDERLRREPGVEVAVCRLSQPDGEISAILEKASVLHLASTRHELPERWVLGEALIGRCPRLAFVSVYGAGYDTLDLAACTRAGIPVANQAGGNAVSVAETTLGLILSLLHRLAQQDRYLRSQATPADRETFMGNEAAGRTLGLVGIGNIGRRVAGFARAFGMRVLAFDPYLSAEEIASRGAESVPFERLLQESDIVSLHCPRTSETLRMLDAAAFGRMKKGALFVSTARGGIHDERALESALASGQVGGAGLDVWDREPPPADHPLFRFDNVIGSWHTGGVTREARRNIAVIGAEQVVQVLRGERPPRLVNPEVWEKRRPLKR